MSVALGLGISVVGCTHPPSDELTKGVVSGERPVAMEGVGAFFDGKIIAKVTLSRGIGHGLKRSGKDDTYQKYTDSDGKMVIGVPVPPVTLHLILENKGTETVTVKMIDFVSDMGNFAIDPDSLTLAPGQTAEPNSMVSDLGVSSNMIAFKVTLKAGTNRESRTIEVRSLVDEPGGAPVSR